MKILKKIIITSIICIFTLLLYSCPDIIEKSIDINKNNDSHIVIDNPSQNGLFTLTISSARSIYPNTPLLSEFTSFELEFTHVPGEAGIDATFTPSLTAGGDSLEPVILAQGIYNLIVTAYKGTSPAARGNRNGIEIKPGELNEYTITLKTLLTEGQGEFKWNINFPAGLATAEMKILDSNGNPAEDPAGSPIPVVDLLSTPISGSVGQILNSGTYTIVFNMERDGVLGTSNNKELEWKEIVFIYAALETNFNFTFEEKHFNTTSYTVTFYDNIQNGSGYTQKSFMHGSNIGVDAPLYTTEWTGYTHMGWCTDEITLTNFWDTDNTPLYNDLTLYAKWLPDKEFYVTYTPVNSDDKGPKLTGTRLDTLSNVITIYRPNIPETYDAQEGAGYESAVVNVTNPEKYTKLEWYISSYASNPIKTSNDPQTDFSITLNSANPLPNNPQYNFYGDKILTVTGTYTEDGARYTTNVILRVVPVFTVTFNPDNGQPVTPRLVPINGYVSSLSATPTAKAFPLKAGLYRGTPTGNETMSFSGWRKAGETSNYIFGYLGTPITGNIVLNAQWTAPSNYIPLDDPYDVSEAFTYVNTYLNAAPHTFYIDRNINVSLSNTLSIYGSSTATSAGLTIKAITPAGEPSTEERVIQYTGSDTFVTLSYTGVNLTLDTNVTLRGTSNSSCSSPLVTINGGTFTMNAGSKITGHTTSSTNGAVSIAGAYDDYNEKDARFILNGEISGNKSTSTAVAANGGVTLNYGTFTMNANSKVTGNYRSSSIPADVFVSVTNSSSSTAFNLNGDADVGVLKLQAIPTYSTSYYTETTRSFVNLTSTKKRDTILHLIGNNTDVALECLEGREGDTSATSSLRYIRGSGYTLIEGAAGDVAKFKLGDFMGIANSGTNTWGISATHEMPNSGTYVGRLLPKNAHTPFITGQPANEIKYIWKEGSEMIMKLTITVASPIDEGTLSYQWYRSDYYKDSGGVKIAGATNSTYIPDTSQLGYYYYYCVVTNENISQRIQDHGLSTTASRTSNVTKVTIYDETQTTVYVEYTNSTGLVKEEFVDLGTAFRFLNNDDEYDVRIIANQTIPNASSSLTKDTNFAGSVKIKLRVDTGKSIIVNTPSYGITIGSGITLVLNEGITLQGSSSRYYPAIIINSGGTLEMNSGTITGNSNTDSYTYGGGIHNAGTLDMKGGSITGNSVSYGNGGGVYNTGTFNMSGGTISSNNSNGYNGAGVYNTGTFNMTGGSIRSNNSSYGSGAGIYNTGTFTMSGSSAITNNTSSGNGAGVYNTNTFNMSGGSITGNSVSTSIDTNTNFTSSNGGGVFNTGTNAVINLSGNAQVTGNTAGSRANNIYLSKTNLTADGPIIIGASWSGSAGVCIPLNTNAARPYVNNIARDANSSAGFTSDNINDFELVHSGTTLALKLKDDVNYLVINQYSNDTINYGGWNGAKLNVNIAGTITSCTYAYSTQQIRVTKGQNISFTWTAGTRDASCAFIAYLVTEPPNPSFSTSTSTYWSGTVANNPRASWKLYNYTSVLQTFTVP